MQRPPGLTYAELVAYHRALAVTQERRIRVNVLDLDENVIGSLTPQILDGQITIDVDRDPKRILEFTFLDPGRVVQFDPGAPGNGQLHRSRMIQIEWSTRVTEISQWVTVDAFTGPVWDFDRTGPVVTIVAHGKELLANGTAWTPRTFPAKTRKTKVIRELLQDAGEVSMEIPNLPITTPHRATITHLGRRCARAQQMARSMDRDLFPDGRGVFVLRKRSTKPVFTFDKRRLLADPVIDRDPEGVINRWEILGAKPKGAKKRVSAVVNLPINHPLSTGPNGLGRNGKPTIYALQVENNHIKTTKEAKARGTRMRDDAMRTITSYTFDAIPIPHLDEYDMVRLVCDDGTFLVRIRQLTLPLGAEGSPPMTIGVLRRTTRARRRRVLSSNGIKGTTIKNRR